jgi:hypothetical protein
MMMSEQELYEIARDRIDRRNRRWTWWSVHLAAFIAYVGLFVMITISNFNSLALFGLLAWSGLFVLHCIVLGMAESRDGDIEGEVTKLRKVANYDKPKRLALGEDGELVDIEQDDDLRQKIK